MRVQMPHGQAPAQKPQPMHFSAVADHGEFIVRQGLAD